MGTKYQGTYKFALSFTTKRGITVAIEGAGKPDTIFKLVRRANRYGDPTKKKERAGYERSYQIGGYTEVGE